MIRETLHCCRVSCGRTGEDEAVLSKQPASSGDTGTDEGAGENDEGVLAVTISKLFCYFFYSEINLEIIRFGNSFPKDVYSLKGGISKKALDDS